MVGNMGNKMARWPPHTNPRGNHVGLHSSPKGSQELPLFLYESFIHLILIQNTFASNLFQTCHAFPLIAK